MTTAEPERGSPQVVGLARTRDEAILFLDLRPCERCGSVDMTWDSALVFIDGRAARSYFATCPACGLERKYTFWAPDPRTQPARPEGAVSFGGPEPSELLDAGEWLWVADLTASRVPVNDQRAAWRALAIATAAMDEILKFVPPEAREVPDSGFWSARGHRVRAEEPGRFDRERLVIVRDTYRGERDAVGEGSRR
jgi:hypothetical protein